jgi:hypothetical protein
MVISRQERERHGLIIRESREIVKAQETDRLHRDMGILFVMTDLDFSLSEDPLIVYRNAIPSKKQKGFYFDLGLAIKDIDLSRHPSLYGVPVVHGKTRLDTEAKVRRDMILKERELGDISGMNFPYFIARPDNGKFNFSFAYVKKEGDGLTTELQTYFLMVPDSEYLNKNAGVDATRKIMAVRKYLSGSFN